MVIDGFSEGTWVPVRALLLFLAPIARCIKRVVAPWVSNWCRGPKDILSSLIGFSSSTICDFVVCYILAIRFGALLDGEPWLGPHTLDANYLLVTSRS